MPNLNKNVLDSSTEFAAPDLLHSWELEMLFKYMFKVFDILWFILCLTISLFTIGPFSSPFVILLIHKSKCSYNISFEICFYELPLYGYVIFSHDISQCNSKKLKYLFVCFIVTERKSDYHIMFEVTFKWLRNTEAV